MKLWSRGLGRSELEMDFRCYKIQGNPENNGIAVYGIINPVNWEFKITFDPEDVPGMIKMALNRKMIFMVIKNIYKYFIYLVKRKQFQGKDYSIIDQKVSKAYEDMMKRKRLSIS
ncbi:MAG TPA: hypothetical protein VII00_06815 [bacterium]